MFRKIWTLTLDIGAYTCQAKTELDDDTRTASLIVQDVPNPPELKWVTCDSKDASVVWEPRGDNRAPILTYKIQYNTTFLTDTWETASGKKNILKNAMKKYYKLQKNSGVKSFCRVMI